MENFPQISAESIAFQQNLLGKLSQNRPFFTNCFSAKLASKLPAKFPRNRPFFPRICPWKFREIWLFFPQPTRSPEEMIVSWYNKLTNSRLCRNSLTSLRSPPKKIFQDGVKGLYVIQYWLLLACSWTSHCVTGGWEASLGDERPRKVESLAICLRGNLTGIPTYLPVKITKL